MTAQIADFFHGRHAGVLLPLFAAPSAASWGVGELPDVAPIAAWLRRAGFDFLQLLPLNEMATGQSSPYSAISAMAVDPLYVSLGGVEDFAALGGEDALGAERRAALAAVRGSARIDYPGVRALKAPVLRACFDRFVAAEWARGTPRAEALRRFAAAERWWLDDYALYRALRSAYREAPWWEWEAPLRERRPKAIAAARHQLQREVLFAQYLQWLADAQWRGARRASAPVGLFGDLPFMVGADSADVWAHAHAFRLDATVGTPPDAFSATGQDWGLPVYRWDVLASEHDGWICDRAHRGADLFDGYRVDHLVGFYRTYFIPRDGSPRGFVPAEVAAQLAQGERLMRIFIGTGARVVAEDLGTVPDFVRDSLERLGLPGFRVLRWEREWQQPGQPFRDPTAWPAASVGTTSTHDTETLAGWWEAATPEERAAVGRIPRLQGALADPADGAFGAAVRDELLALMYASGSDLLLLPVQDLFGWRDRINTPATLTDDNWTWRLPWPADRLASVPEAAERAAVLRHLAERHGRVPV